MLSILIPIYNCDVNILVKNLDVLGNNLDIPFEIVLLDDGSTEEYKRKHQRLNQIPSVRYDELPENIGRAEIRNRLATMAKYPYLLFMDADSEVMYNDYLSNFMKVAKGKLVIFGGRIYSMIPPKDKRKYLRWKYGVHRESTKADERRKNPHRSFMTSNFLITKSIFDKIRFDKHIRTYGHEDTLFGFELKKAGIPIRHIDNPLVHIGLENSRVFLDKTREGIKNLLKIAERMDNPEEFIHEVKLLEKYHSIKGTWKENFLIRLLTSNRRRIEKHLIGKHPLLFIFDLYKLMYIAYVGRNRK